MGQNKLLLMEILKQKIQHHTSPVCSTSRKPNPRQIFVVLKNGHYLKGIFFQTVELHIYFATVASKRD